MRKDGKTMTCDHLEIIINTYAPKCVNKKLVDKYGGEQYFLGLCVSCKTSMMEEVNKYKETDDKYQGRKIYRMVGE